MLVNLGNYSSAEGFMSIVGIKAETTTEEMQVMATQGEDALRILYHKVSEDIKKIQKKEKQTP